MCSISLAALSCKQMLKAPGNPDLLAIFVIRGWSYLITNPAKILKISRKNLQLPKRQLQGKRTKLPVLWAQRLGLHDVEHLCNPEQIPTDLQYEICFYLFHFHRGHPA